MITPEDFIAEWQDRSHLCRYDANAVAALRLPDRARAFLTNAGLPLSSITPVITRVYTDLPRVGDIYGGDYLMPDDCGELRAFAEYRAFGDVLSYYALDEPGGQVFCVGKWVKRSYARMFMNSSVNQFAEFLLVHMRYIECVSQASTRQLPAIDPAHDEGVEKDCAEQALADLRLCDPEACTEADLFLSTGETYTGSSLPKQEWTESLLAMERMGYWY